jgi:hypothetical protein
MSRDSATLVADLAKAHIAARCLHVVADFGVADALGAEVSTAAAIAQRTGLHADALERILRLLAAHGVFEQRPGGYAHNDASRRLCSDHPQSLRLYVRMTGMPGFWDRFTDLHHAAATGTPAVDWPGMLERFAAHPEEGAIFNAAMTAKSRRAVHAVANAYDWRPCQTIADVGGGRGHLLAAVLERAPQAHGILFELPHVVGDAAPAPRLQIIAGDFFADPLPTADAYLLMDLLHDWTDADAARILAGVRRAAPAQARLLIIETLAPEAPGPHFGKTLDVIMLAVTGGRERTPTQHEALLAANGFRLERILATDSEYSLLEAAAA